MDVLGYFDSIQDAQNKIPKLQEILSSPFYPTTSVLRIVQNSEYAVNDYFVYSLGEF
jgi:hypothetical protein